MSSSRGDARSSVESCAGEVGEEASESRASFRLDFEPADNPLLPDLTDATSDLSAVASPLDKPVVEPLGLSVLLPGILDLSAPRKDLVDSFVSALLNEG